MKTLLQTLYPYWHLSHLFDLCLLHPRVTRYPRGRLQRSHIRELGCGDDEGEGLGTEQLPILPHIQLPSALCATGLKGSCWKGGQS